jgi:hypothetical protein
MLERRLAQDTQRELIHEEHPSFLKQIKHINKELAVIFKFRVEKVGAFPNLGSSAEGFQASGEVTRHIIHDIRHGPGREGGGEEKGIQQPSVLEMKTRGSRDGGGGSDKKRDMVRGWTVEGEERRVGKS